MILSLLYHDVVAPGLFDSSGFPHRDAHIYKLERPQFELQLQKIEQTPKPAKVAVLDRAGCDIGSEALLFTFDDGGVSALLIATLLEVHGWRGHFFITTDYIGKPGFLKEDQIRELRDRGHVVGSHSCSHPARISYCSQEQLLREWQDSARVLSNILGNKLRVASVPGGYYSRRVAEAAASSGIEVLFNSEPTSRITHIQGCMVLGRYSIQQGVSAETVTRIVSGERLPRLRQYLLWNSKKLAKRLGGNYYISLRKSLLRNAGSP